ncbi:MAG: amidohydrolase family protein, partial [Methylotenera sp.]
MQTLNDPTMPPQVVDLTLEARWVAVLRDDCALIEHHAVVIKDGLIVDILPIADAKQRYSARETSCLDEHVLIPGLINLHTHAAMSLMRGIADDLPLMEWLNQHIWPTERAVVMEDYVRDASLHACAEMLSGGVTCFNDMYFFPKATAAAVNQ